MGNVNSPTMLPPPDVSNVPFFAMTFRRPNSMCLALADADVVDLIRRVMLECWPYGFEFVGRLADDSYQFIFNGSPFIAGERREYSRAIRRLLIRLLCDLYADGYDFVLSSELSRNQTDWTTWFFQQRLLATLRPPRAVCCIGFGSDDIVQLICAQEHLKNALRDAVAGFYPSGIESVRTYDDADIDAVDGYFSPSSSSSSNNFYNSNSDNNSNRNFCYEIKLNGSPWNSSASSLSGLYARRTILAIFRRFSECRFKFYASANLKNVADCIFFIEELETSTATVTTSIDEDDGRHASFCMISLDERDKLKLIECTTEFIDLTRRIILEQWQPGIQSERGLIEDEETNWAHEFHLYGSPWWTAGLEALNSRSLIGRLFDALLSTGWRLVCSLNINRRFTEDKSIFVLRSRAPVAVPHFCLSFDETDKMRVLNTHTDVPDMIGRIIGSYWPKGVAHRIKYYDSREIQLKGRPWEPSTLNESSHVRVLLCYLLTRFYRNGWRVALSTDVTSKFVRKPNGEYNPVDVHSWFVVYNPEKTCSTNRRNTVLGLPTVDYEEAAGRRGKYSLSSQ